MLVKKRGAAHLWVLIPAIGAAAPLFAAVFLSQETDRAAPLIFEKDVQPIFKAHCFSCHGPGMHMANLRFDSFASVMKGGDSGKAIVPKKSASSLLVSRIEGKGGKPQMPMGMAALSAAQIKTIRNWIDQGAMAANSAEVGKHWAYVKPVRPELPIVKQANWVRNPIDAFVLEQIEAQDLKPSPPATKEALLRRVSLDLTGLPPSLAQIDAFVNDKSPNAYEKVVDRLLASPHYGERQAQIWLDLSRFADSDGYEKDLNRTAWKYRDWLIDAFNKNLPYDEFITEQMAGDLIPNHTMDQWIATGFHRNSMLNLEGGVDQAEAQYEVILDRVNTTANVFLGTTMQCSRCHDHKYDPFTQKEYFRLFAFFSNPDYKPRGDANVGEEKWVEPTIEVPTPQQAKLKAQVEQNVVDLNKRLSTRTPAQELEQRRWEKWALEPADWVGLRPVTATATSGAELKFLPYEIIQAYGPVPDKDVYKITFRLPGRTITGLRLLAMPSEDLPNKGPGRADNGNFVIAKIELRVDGKELSARLVRADHEQQGFPIANAFDMDANSGWAISPKFGMAHEAIIELSKPIPETAKELDVVLDQRSNFLKHVLGKFSFSWTASEGPAMRLQPEDIRAILSSDKRTPADQKKVDDLFASMAPSNDAVRAKLRDAQNFLALIQSRIPTALVLREKPSKGPLFAFVHKRGEFMNPTEKVFTGTPVVLNEMPKGAPANRLGLARWIASKENPLTARVQVNRMWAQVFGRGILVTEEDFGTQSPPPTHPKLLDWLATELMSQSWDLKAIHRLIVTSATYRQSSDASSEHLAKDPTNVWLARGPRFRLDAETIRDTALFASGKLSLKIGGPSVYPYQPENVWNNAYSGDLWPTSKGTDQYRRGLYTYIKRTAPYPAFLNFDATSRETCTVRRIRTNTPLQALTLLNDEAFMEAAKGLAHRMKVEAGPKPEDKVVFGFRLCTARTPTATERSRLASLLSEMESKYSADLKSAKALAGDSESAALTMVANVLLNLDETITKG